MQYHNIILFYFIIKHQNNRLLVFKYILIILFVIHFKVK